MSPFGNKYPPKFGYMDFRLGTLFVNPRTYNILVTNCQTKTLTVGRLEISVNKGDGRPIVEVVHAPGNLNGPVNKDLGANLATSKNSKTE